MGKMKELFMRQIENQMNDINADADYDYELYLKQMEEQEAIINSINDQIKSKYSDADVKHVLLEVFGTFNVSERLKDEIIEKIMNDLNNLNNLRNGNSN
jgi:nucleoid DNA-binding protein